MLKNTKRKGLFKAFFIALLLSCSFVSNAQDERIQYPGILENSYFGVNIGYINYPFSPAQLENGNTVGSIEVPHTAVRVILFGHQFNKNLSAQISYMRPVNWVEYKNLNQSGQTRTVWMNVAGLTLLYDYYFGKRFSLNLEAGLGLIMRKGFELKNETVVQNASYATGLFGGSFKYHINEKWEVQLGTVWSPENESMKQPSTTFVSAGFNYYMRQLPKKKVEQVKAAGYFFPKQIIAVAYTSNILGYGANKAVSEGPVPVFWGGEVKVDYGLFLSYQRNIFHTKKVFALDWGVGLGFWESNGNRENFFSISAYPVLRLTLLRSKKLDAYLEYAIAGPTYISKTKVDGLRTGTNFTFYDIMGVGFFIGKNKTINASLRISHFSNGNLFPYNEGFMVPLTLNLGYVID